MASPASRSEKFAAKTPTSFAAIAASPDSVSTRVLKTPLSDQAIWKRLKEAGFDEESIKRRDKVALIAYIAKLEAEIYDHQHHMGPLILERKDWLSKYEEAKATADAAELSFKRERASHVSDLADAKKQDESLKKALGIEKECVKNIEKTLHEMRAEYAEVKVASESKFTEARSLMDGALKKLTEADEKMCAAESLEAEASRYHRTAERKLHEVEEREDELRKRIVWSKSDFETKEKEIKLERQALSERQSALQQMHGRLLEGQSLLNQREEHVFNKTQELQRFEKELEDSRLNIDKERQSLIEERVSLELQASSLSDREEAVVKREGDLLKKEHELLLFQAKLESKESESAQQIMSNHEATLAIKNSAYKAEAEMKRKLLEDELNAWRRDWELREIDIKNREDYILERERELEVESRHLKEKEKEADEKLSTVEAKQENLLAAEENLELKEKYLNQEKEDMCRMKLDLEKYSELLEEKKKYISDAEEKIELMRNEANELMVLQVRLKEEIDIVSAQKLELEAEANHLKAEKAKFEAEWDIIDEKREKLEKEAEQSAEERISLFKFLKDERDSLKTDKDALRDQYKRDLELLSHDRETFMKELEKERTEWFLRIQKERSNFVRDIEMQKEELDNCTEKRREEIENYLMEREKKFEKEKERELEHIASLKERAAKELEHVNSEMQRLDAERREINLDRERREQEWIDLNNSIQELKIQREKLEKQRELLRADREEIHAQIETLKKLEDLKEKLDSIELHDMMHQTHMLANSLRPYVKRCVNQQEFVLDQNGSIDKVSGYKICVDKEFGKSSSPLSAPLSWLKRCADTLLDQRRSNKKRKAEKDATAHESEELTPCLPQKSSKASMIGSAAKSISRNLADPDCSVFVDKVITIEELTTVAVENIAGNFQEPVLHPNKEKIGSNGEVELETNGKL